MGVTASSALLAADGYRCLEKRHPRVPFFMLRLGLPGRLVSRSVQVRMACAVQGRFTEHIVT
jgi:hypothetical protein